VALGTDAPTALDVPADLVDGSRLGRVVNYERALAVFGRGPVEHLARHYNIGDEVGYAAYLALRSVEGAPGPGRKMFLQALEHGIDSVEGAPPELVTLFKAVDEVPDWVDWDQLHRGSVAYWRVGKLTVMALAYAAIGAGFRTYGGSRELVLSRRLIERDQVGRRLIETLRWAANASKPGGMRRHSDGFRMTMKVRMLHAAVRYHCSRSRHWDWNDWGISVDNVSAVYTMGTLFTEAVIDALAKGGIRLSPSERDDIVALWRYIGYVMGIPEDVNFTDWADLKEKSGIIRMLEHPADDGCRALMRSLIDYMCEEKIEGYHVLPPFVDERLTAAQKKTLTHGLMRAWAGDDICEQLAVPANRLRYLVPAARPLIRAYDVVRRRLPSYDDQAAAWRSLAEFDVAIALEDGAPEVAQADDVVDMLARNEPSARQALDTGTYR
jgi:hypothetical protein